MVYYLDSLPTYDLYKSCFMVLGRSMHAAGHGWLALNRVELCGRVEVKGKLLVCQEGFLHCYIAPPSFIVYKWRMVLNDADA